jgi:hypothetical protein
MRDMPPTMGPWLQHPLYPRCLASEADQTMSLLTVDEDGYGAFLSSVDCRKAAAAPELLDAAIAAEAVLARGKWVDGSTDPEAVALRGLRAAIAKATGAA